MKRCCICGRIACETCHGDPNLGGYMCPECKGVGWRKAEQSYPLEAPKPGAERNALGWEIGTDPAVACPNCEGKCVKCGGQGHVSGFDDQQRISLIACDACHGTGRKVGNA